MPKHREIRADFDRSTVVVYQAYNDAIADAALKEGRFSAPFSLNRMTWIKPSFLWLMERSDWGRKVNQTRVLAVRISREGWDRALSLGVLTAFEPGTHHSVDDWRRQLEVAPVHVQWDPERSLYGKKLDHRAIQVGLSRTVVEEYASNWIREIDDITALAAKIRQLRHEGQYKKARRLLPPERVYPVDARTSARLRIDQ
jgi:hypothetical protein